MYYKVRGRIMRGGSRVYTPGFEIKARLRESLSHEKK